MKKLINHKKYNIYMPKTDWKRYRDPISVAIAENIAIHPELKRELTLLANFLDAPSYSELICYLLDQYKQNNKEEYQRFCESMKREIDKMGGN